jgi:A/G-specific adenine glycosylase
MLQQTQVATVIPYWERWMRVLPTPGALAAASEADVLKLWEGLGYYSRARNLRKAAEIIVRRHGGEFPREFAHVRALPGVGDYTAGAVCSIAFNQPTPAVDGNVIRVLSRVHAIGGDPRAKDVRSTLARAAQGWMDQAARKKKCAELTQALMELGATVCSPRRPKCPECPLRGKCRAETDGQPERFPETRPREKTVPRRFIALAVGREGRYLARRRTRSRVNSGLWEFPNFEADPESSDGDALILAPFKRFRLRPLMRLKHSITKYRITLDVLAGNAPPADETEGLDGQWLSLREMSGMAFTAAHRKILDRLAGGGSTMARVPKLSK